MFMFGKTTLRFAHVIRLHAISPMPNEEEEGKWHLMIMNVPDIALHLRASQVLFGEASLLHQSGRNEFLTSDYSFLIPVPGKCAIRIR